MGKLYPVEEIDEEFVFRLRTKFNEIIITIDQSYEIIVIQNIANNF